MIRKRKELLGEMMIDRGLITHEQLEDGLQISKKSGERIGESLIKLGFATSEEVLTTLAQQLNLPFIKLKNYQIHPSVIEKIPAKFVFHYKLIPIKIEHDKIQIATSDPLDMKTIDDIRLLLTYDVETAIATPEDISEAIKKYYGIGAETVQRMTEESAEEKKKKKKEVEFIGTELTGAEDITDMAEDASIIKFVNQILAESFASRTTDVHIEPFENELRVRYRIDGMLHEQPVPAVIKKFQAAICSRIKIMANMNIAERRLPQDGRIQVKMSGHEYDLRVSTLPTAYGESIDIRVLDRSSILLSLEQLGLSAEGVQQFNTMLKKPHGVILVTGPTGSGKTTTLYACLNKINSIDRMIITIEDPIEYELHGINQIEVQPKIDLTFARCLRHILRHDPNVILVGEIRDHETAEIAIRTALTGHLVFSTLHTNDASGAVTRLLDMDIEPYLAASSVEGMIAQRLVRVICTNCKKEYTPDPTTLSLIDTGYGDKPPEISTKLFRGTGCEACRFTGYKGRIAIFEIIMLTDKIKNLIMQRAPANLIRQAAMTAGMRPLRQDGWEKVLNGITTVDEVLRVTQEEEFAE
jgi:type II secretion system protein E